MDKTIPKNNTRILAPSDLEKISKEDLKSIFYMMVGRPDSQYKVFDNQCLVKVENVLEINRRIADKLSRHYNIHAQVTSIDVFFQDNRAIQFAVWEEFEGHDWKENSRVESVAIKWDFFLNLPHFQIPQRHTLTLKISSEIKAKDVFAILLQNNDDDNDPAELLMATMVCRADFIDNILGDELIDIVAKWNESLEQKDSTLNFYLRRQALINALSQYSFTCFCLVWWTVAYTHFVPTIATNMAFAAYFVVSSFFMFNLFQKTSEVIVRHISGQIVKSVKIPTLVFTVKDLAHFKKRMEKRKHTLAIGILKLSSSIVINVLSAVIAVKYHFI